MISRKELEAFESGAQRRYESKQASEISIMGIFFFLFEVTGLAFVIGPLWIDGMHWGHSVTALIVMGLVAYAAVIINAATGAK